MPSTGAADDAEFEIKVFWRPPGYGCRSAVGSLPMTWTAITESELTTLITEGVAAMEPPARWLWSLVRIRPVKWQLTPWGDMGGGFWAVGVLGEHVIWFNDIEWGFNISRYESFGVIAEYWCNQDELQHTMYGLLRQLDGFEAPPRLRPPEPIDDA